MEKHWENFKKKGWSFLTKGPRYSDWLEAALNNILNNFQVSSIDKNQLRSGQTWFVGMNFLKNTSDGSLGKISFDQVLLSQIEQKFGVSVDYWDRGQVSINWEGYPKKDIFETDLSYRYRLKYFASHVDGLIPVGVKKRRYLKEPHAFVLGLPVLNNFIHSAPLVVWEGSHLIIRSMFNSIFREVEDTELENIDVTDFYKDARRQIFSSCTPRRIFSTDFQPYILDRHLLHGVAPWISSKKSQTNTDWKSVKLDPLDGRIIIYFRPYFKNLRNWIRFD